MKKWGAMPPIPPPMGRALNSRPIPPSSIFPFTGSNRDTSMITGLSLKFDSNLKLKSLDFKLFKHSVMLKQMLSVVCCLLLFTTDQQ